MFKKLAFAFSVAVAAVIGVSSNVHAHGAVGMLDNRCILRNGPDIMFFTSYQPQSSQGEFCDELPSGGRTIVAIEMQNNELRDMLIEIRIIKDDGKHTKMLGLPFLTDAELTSNEILDSVTVVYLPPKKYPDGILTYEYTFPEIGKYIGIVTTQNEHGQTYVSQFPFSVGRPRLLEPGEATIPMGGVSMLPTIAKNSAVSFLPYPNISTHNAAMLWSFGTLSTTTYGSNA